MAEIPIPSSISDMTPNWVKLVTGHQVKSDSLRFETDIQEGFGYISSICRVSYQTENGTSHSIIVKLLPADPKCLDIALQDCSHERELQFYTNVLPDLLKAVPALADNMCGFYKGRICPGDPATNKPPASLLVLDDLNVQDYQMMNYSGDGSPHVLESLLTFCAQLHYAAFAVSLEKGKPLSELYPFLQGITKNKPWISKIDELSKNGYVVLEDLLKRENIDESVWKRYEKLKPITYEIIEKVDENGRKMPCLIHGDLWPPNCLVHKSKPVKALDWQIMRHSDVTFDLAILLYTVLPKDMLTMEVMRNLLRRYWQKFEDLCAGGVYKDRVKRRSWEEFEEFFFTWGTAFGYIVFLPWMDCYDKAWAKYANVMRFLCEDVGLTEFLFKACSAT